MAERMAFRLGRPIEKLFCVAECGFAPRGDGMLHSCTFGLHAEEFLSHTIDGTAVGGQ